MVDVVGRLLAGPLLCSLLGRRYGSFERAMNRGGTELLLNYEVRPLPSAAPIR